ncbi:MAG: helix-turn-helix domain-containing protein [Eubacteriales bacterium]|nr:helix-turn-helix domain-containing protein [Eubacteriales bacterium]
MARKYKRLCYSDRQAIEKMSRAGVKIIEIAAALGVHRDTIYKEFARCGATPETYSADIAQKAL